MTRVRIDLFASLDGYTSAGSTPDQSTTLSSPPLMWKVPTLTPSPASFHIHPS